MLSVGILRAGKVLHFTVELWGKGKNHWKLRLWELKEDLNWTKASKVIDEIEWTSEDL